ncbi:hypothetical protein MTR67_017847 [Solanum verrucosum]|uniref:Reverse transcriptase RNase H-like domain-containing protein n=1 Tax=Solanum verrucosum TaxID=315347 RepID=A0AAF0QIP1_SOLVR|nr:hypothetical protein MTR67_017847 [Solanum verrucosum]
MQNCPSEFWGTSVTFLGHVVSKEGIMVDPQKIKAVKNWVKPSSVTELKVHDRNHPTHDLQLATVVFFLNIWRHYLYGVKCQMFTNHRSLQDVFTQKDLNLRQRRWMELLKDYDVTIQYHSDKSNVVADTLIRKMGAVVGWDTLWRANRDLNWGNTQNIIFCKTSFLRAKGPPRAVPHQIPQILVPKYTVVLFTDTSLALSLLSTGHLQAATDRPDLGDH